MKLLNSSTIEEIILDFEKEAIHQEYQLKTKIVQPPRHILDVVSVLQFSKGGNVLTISILGEFNDDLVMLIIATDEKLQNRKTIFKTLDNLTFSECIATVGLTKEVALRGDFFCHPTSKQLPPKNSLKMELLGTFLSE